MQFFKHVLQPVRRGLGRGSAANSRGAFNVFAEVNYNLGTAQNKCDARNIAGVSVRRAAPVEICVAGSLFGHVCVCVCGGCGGNKEQRQSIISGMFPVHGALDYLRELAIDQQSESAGQPPLASQQYCPWLRPPLPPPQVGLLRFGGQKKEKKMEVTGTN